MSDEPEGKNDKALAFLAGLLVGLGPTVALLPSWEAAWQTPTFLGLLMGVAGGILGAVYVRSRTWKTVLESIEPIEPPKV